MNSDEKKFYLNVKKVDEPSLLFYSWIGSSRLIFLPLSPIICLVSKFFHLQKYKATQFAQFISFQVKLNSWCREEESKKHLNNYNDYDTDSDYDNMADQLSKLQPKQPVMVYYNMDDSLDAQIEWHRGKIFALSNGNSVIRVNLIDEGKIAVITNLNHIIFNNLPAFFNDFPAQVKRCSLAFAKSAVTKKNVFFF